MYPFGAAIYKVITMAHVLGSEHQEFINRMVLKLEKYLTSDEFFDDENKNTFITTGVLAEIVLDELIFILHDIGLEKTLARVQVTRTILQDENAARTKMLIRVLESL